MLTQDPIKRTWQELDTVKTLEMLGRCQDNQTSPDIDPAQYIYIYESLWSETGLFPRRHAVRMLAKSRDRLTCSSNNTQN